MNLATKITALRILLIPVFVLFCLWALSNGRDDVPEGNWGLWAAVVFLIAAVSDWLDGFIARRFHQESHLGRVLDPLADKGLMLSALVLLTFSTPPALPLWYAVLIVSKDVLCVFGYAFLKQSGSSISVRPHWTGKVSTALQMTSILWVLFGFPNRNFVIIPAAVFTVISGTIYLFTGWKQAQQLHESSSNLP